jgi:hypothetical protein
VGRGAAGVGRGAAGVGPGEGGRSGAALDRWWWDFRSKIKEKKENIITD